MDCNVTMSGFCFSAAFYNCSVLHLSGALIDIGEQGVQKWRKELNSGFGIDDVAHLRQEGAWAERKEVTAHAVPRARF